jgi:hypothetical protein
MNLYRLQTTGFLIVIVGLLAGLFTYADDYRGLEFSTFCLGAVQVVRLLEDKFPDGVAIRFWLGILGLASTHLSVGDIERPIAIVVGLLTIGNAAAILNARRFNLSSTIGK